MEEYIEKFEELKSLMIIMNLILLKFYYISSLISGFKEDFKPILKILKPITLMQTFEQANDKRNQV